MKKIYSIAILRPAGNDTALVRCLVNETEKKQINDVIMKQFPTVEQVGFYEKTKAGGTLEMAGGEFCGNATRSLAYLLLNGKVGSTILEVSGANKPLVAGVKSPNPAFAQMPIISSLESVKQLSETTTLVQMQGIVHLIVSRKPNNKTPNAIKAEGKKLMEKYNLLLAYPAAGVMFVSRQTEKSITMNPVIWVRDIKTLFYETACASGTTAVGLWIATGNNKTIKDLKVIQPSKQSITVSVTNKQDDFACAFIDGPIEIIKMIKI